MKTFTICAILMFGLVWTVQGHAAMTFLHARLIRANTCNNPGEEFCSADCKNMIYCNINNDAEKTDCLATTGKPYCQNLGPNNVQCTNDPSTCSSPPDKCPSENGRFPNLLDCTKFVYCIGGVPTDYQCQPKFIYDGGKYLCAPNTKCYNYSTFNGLCKGKVNVRLAYPLNTKLFVYCTSEGPKLRKCRGDDENNIKFDPILGTCVFTCPGEGLFKDSDDNKYFYECVKVGNVLQGTRRECPDGTIFDDIQKECINDQ